MGSVLHYFDLGGVVHHENAARPIAGGLAEILVSLPNDGSRSHRVYYEQSGGVIAVDYSAKAKVDESTPTLGETALREQCDYWVKQHQESKVERYVVCVDVTTDGNPNTVVVPVHFNDSEAENGHLWTNKSLDVYVYYAKDRVIEVKLSGSVGRTSTVYVQKKESVTERVAMIVGVPPPATPPLHDGITCLHQAFGPRSPGTSPVLETALKKKKKEGGLEDVAKYNQEFYIEREYRAAIRAGLAVLVGPLDKKYEVRTTTGNNAGSEVVIAQSTVPSADLTVGLSLFTGRVGEFGSKPEFSWYFGLSFLTGDAKGADVFTALMTGPELSLGKDFSIAAVGGVRRTMVLKDGFQPHSPVTSPDVREATVFGLTPVVGIMVNLSPYVWSVGR